MTTHELVHALARTTLATSLAAAIAWYLLRRFQFDSPRIHRLAWLLVITQGWLLVPWTLTIETVPLDPIAVQFKAIEVSQSFSAAPLTSQLSHGVPLRVDVLGILSHAAVIAWIMGAVVAALPFAWRYAQFAWRLPRIGAQSAQEWQVEWQRQLRKAKVRRAVELRVTDDLGPLLCWLPFRYLVLVPQTLWELLNRLEREAILRHELAHYVRGDLWKSLLIRILALPQWFNPLAWHAVRAFDEAGEWACDDMVSREHPDGELTLARSLVRVGEFSMQPVPGALAARGGVLSRRIRRLVAPDFKEESKLKKSMVIGMPLLLAAVQLVRIEQVTAEEARSATAANRVETTSSETPNGNDAGHPSTIGARTNNQSNAPATSSERFNWADREHYVIEPPDVLFIKANKIVPRSTIKISRVDSLLVMVGNAPASAPVCNAFEIDGEGMLDLGPTYGRVRVAGFTIEQATANIRHKLRYQIDKPDVLVSWAVCSATPTISQKVLVGPDGRIDLLEYGTIYVAGMTCVDAEETIESKLRKSSSFDDVEVSVDSQQNSKVVYLILDNSDSKDVVSLPCTRGMTVGELLQQAAPKSIDLASGTILLCRPPAQGIGEDIEKTVAWDSESNQPTIETNFRLLPRDRVYVTGSTLLPSPKKKPQTIAEWMSQPRDEDLPNYYAAIEPQIAQAAAKHKAARQAEAVLASGRPVFIVLQYFSADSSEMISQPTVVPEISKDTRVWDILSKQAWPQPIDFATAEITVHRPTTPEAHWSILTRSESERRVVWDAEENRPTEATNFYLSPGDRIFVEVPQVSPTASAKPSPEVDREADSIGASAIRADLIDINSTTGRTTARGLQFVGQPKPSQVVFNIDLVTDPEGSLTEFKSLENGTGFMVTDTKTVLPALRILEKHELIRTISSPRIVCTTGQKAQLEVGGQSSSKKGPWQGLKLEASCREVGTDLAIEVRLESTHSQDKFELNTSLVVADGETVIMRTDRPDASNGALNEVKNDQKVSKAYVVLTPTLIK